MKRTIWLYLVLIVISVFLVIPSIGILFPSDVLRNIPSFSEEGWQRPKNALQADPVYQFEPWRDFARDELLSGRIPLWNDLNGNGAPFLANSINASLYPLNILYYVLPTGFAITVMHLLKLCLFFCFFYLYLRTIKIAVPIAMLGAFAGTFSGYMLLWLYWPQTNVYLLLPLVLFATERIYQTTKYRYRWYSLIAITYFLMILGNHPETLFHIGLLHVGYSFFRFWTDIKTLGAILFSIVVGFLLGAMQILPLLEYLRYSYVLENRSIIPHNFSLPIISILLMGIPFMFGAPHLPYYRHITPTTNFQEVLGGYTGIIILIVGIIGIFKFSKDTFVRFWTVVILLSLMMAYNVWPIKYINALPLMSASANHRLIAFVSFGLIIIFCIVIQNIHQGYIFDKYKAQLADKVFLLLTLISIVISVVAGIYLPQHLPKYADFIPFFQWHLLLLLLSTIFFFWMLAWYMQKRISSMTLIAIGFLLVGIQTFGLFWNYNPLVNNKYFYPKTDVVRMLENLPRGNVIEVGNPSLPANINMKYKISHAINNDAVEILWYRHALSDLFPEKNHWGNPESITVKNMQRLNVSYVLSDYDFTLQRSKIQPDGSTILHPITKGAPYLIPFKPETDNFVALRVKTANYNRQNTCHLHFRLFVRSTHTEVMDRQVPCADIRNNMFYTLSVPRVGLDKNTEYQLEVRSDTDNQKNAIAFFGIHNKPYLELLAQPENATSDYTLVGKTKSTYIWRVNGTERIEGVDDYKILYENPQKLVFDISSGKPTDILIKKTYYPGWEASVNGSSVSIQNGKPFMKITVDGGRSYVEITYDPLSFKVGSLISLVTMLGLLIYMLRNSKETFVTFFKKASIDKKIKRHPFWMHAAVVAIGLIVSIWLYTVLALSLSLDFRNPWTSAINWFTKHNYPRYADYFYFYGGFFFTTIFTFLFWLTWVWRKRH
jgi:hypothetical protein